MNEVVSVVIRTLNEQKHLKELLSSIKTQKSERFEIEIVIVDSGSTDKTLDIAEAFNCRITHIEKEIFTFGRSLNMGCDFANGDYLVFVSGHCIPLDENWINNLVIPLADSEVAYTYGRQIGRDTTKFSEMRIFEKYFPSQSRIPQVGFFCNNANSAIRRNIWQKFTFNEELTGVEDMYLAKQLVSEGEKMGYVAQAPVYHIHDETWTQVKNRYEREAIALQKIMPEMHFGISDFTKCVAVGVLKDFKAALIERVFWREFWSILRFRFAQYHGAYTGHHIHRKISHEMKMKYFYPGITDMDVTDDR